MAPLASRADVKVYSQGLNVYGVLTLSGPILRPRPIIMGSIRNPVSDAIGY